MRPQIAISRPRSHCCSKSRSVIPARYVTSVRSCSWLANGGKPWHAEHRVGADVIESAGRRAISLNSASLRSGFSALQVGHFDLNRDASDLLGFALGHRQFQPIGPFLRAP